MCEPAGECVHSVSDDLQLLRGESRDTSRLCCQNESRSPIHELTISLRFLGISVADP
jgi:hypothetical protein